MSLDPTPIDCSNQNENETGKITFHGACAKGDLSMVKIYLAQQGFDMNVRDHLGRTGFHVACFMANLNVIKFLVHKGFDMNIGDNQSRTGFHLACFKGNLNVVQFLLQQGFVMTTADSLGRTGFHGACFKGNLNVVQYIVKQGFDMNITDKNGFTGFHLACTGGKLHKFFVRNGWQIPDDHESIKFHFYGLHGNLNVVQFLVQEGFDINTRDNNGMTGFHAACMAGNLNVIQFFVQEGFDINTGDNNQIPGFIYACLARNLNVVRFLLQHGFEGINKFYFDDMTVLDVLFDSQYDYPDDELFLPCLLILVEAGAELSENDIFEELISTIQNRIIEIAFMKKYIFEKWTGRIAQEITDFTMDPFTKTSLLNLSKFLNAKTNEQE